MRSFLLRIRADEQGLEAIQPSALPPGYGFEARADGSVAIRGDRFGAKPLFLGEKPGERELLVFNDHSAASGLLHPLTPDPAGCWEAMVFDNPLGTRTLFNEVRFIPAGCRLVINKDLSWSLERYWGPAMAPRRELSYEQFEEEAFAHFSRIALAGDKDRNYLIPLSGGQDSRLLLAFLSRSVPAEHIDTVTFAYGRASQEVTYAARAAEALGLREPLFHPLEPAAYLAQLDGMSQRSGGAISAQHAHLFSCLDSARAQRDTHILCLTGFSDAVCGYASSGGIACSFDASSYVKRLDAWSDRLKMPANVKADILQDLRGLYAAWEADKPLSGFDEFLYVTERNPRFHMQVAAVLAADWEIYNPFLDDRLVEFYMGLPASLRRRKDATGRMLARRFPALAGVPMIGSTFSDERASHPLRYARFRMLNAANFALAVVTDDRLSLPNPYHTEQQGTNLRRHHWQAVESGTRSLFSAGVIGRETMGILLRKPYRESMSYSVRYQALTIGRTLERAAA